MGDLNLKGTSKTPSVIFNEGDGTFEISGRSIPENSADFYLPIIEWAEEHAEKATAPVVIRVRLEYFNTSSLKSLVELFRRFEKMLVNGNQVEIWWYYEAEDEDMFESGEDFRQLLKIPIQLVKL
jgi:hypothetical protein